MEKDKINSAMNYRYLSDEAIKEAGSGLFVKHGIFLNISKIEITKITMPAEGKGSRVYDVHAAYRFVDADTGEFIEGEAVGSGADSTDKGVYKAITGAVKYIMHTTFMLRTGDDPERDDAKERQAPRPRADALPGPRTMAKNADAVITDAQAKRLYALTNKAGRTHEQAKEIIARWGYRSSKDIQMKNYEAICAAIESPTATTPSQDKQNCTYCGVPTPTDLLSGGHCPDCAHRQGDAR